jgi:pimeloyl-ACP methyl ester carboxylesterase
MLTQKKVIIFLYHVYLFTHAFGQLVSIENKKFYSASLKQSRGVLVIKPNSCDSEHPCPVLIFLPGWGTSYTSYTDIADSLKTLLAEKKVGPMLVFVPDGLGGWMNMNEYWNSTYNGLFGDYISKDLVEWITQNYAVCKGPSGEHERGYWLIGGWSMGGDGCSRAALSHPDVFSGFIAWSGDLNDDRYRDMFAFINKNECPDFIYSPPMPYYEKLYTSNIWGGAYAFSPDPSAKWKAQFPLEEGTGALREDVFARWMKVSPITMARDYFVEKKNPWYTMHIFVGAGAPDILISLFEFSKDFSDSLFSWGVHHEFFWHNFVHVYLPDTTLLWADAHFAPRPTLQNDVGVFSSGANETLINIYSNADYLPKVLVKNLGLNPVTSITVICKMEESGSSLYSDTTTVDSLAPLQTFQINMRGWHAEKQGDYDVTFITSLTGDEKTSNDTLSTVVKVSGLIDDFESGIQHWYSSGNWGANPDTKNTGEYSLSTNPGNTYQNNVDQNIVYKSGFNLSRLNEAALVFWTQYNTERNADFGYVEVSIDSGKTWQQVGEPYSGVFSWDQVILPLTQFCGPGFTDVRIRFHFVSNEKNTRFGWNIDDVSLAPKATNVEKLSGSTLPSQFKLFDNYPNPFNTQTVLMYQTNRGCQIKLQVFNLLGQKISTLIDRFQQAGLYKIIWEGKDQLNNNLPSGVYIFRFEAGNFSMSKKMLLLR